VPVPLADRSGSAPASPGGRPFDRRRRVSAALTLVVGTSLLAGTLRVRAGSPGFFTFGLAAAAAWILGAVVSGPIPWRPPHRRSGRDVVPAAVLAVLAFLGFLGADLIGRHLPLVSGALHSVLSRADQGPVMIVLAVALVNGLGEELFFRGALFAALERHRPVLGSTLVYVAVTAATGNLALVVAAAAMGTLFSLQRAHTRSVLASTITHLGWSTLMLLALPR
jgi:membrane protease YdiL (CAAX protease family)